MPVCQKLNRALRLRAFNKKNGDSETSSDEVDGLGMDREVSGEEEGPVQRVWRQWHLPTREAEAPLQQSVAAVTVTSARTGPGGKAPLPVH